MLMYETYLSGLKSSIRFFRDAVEEGKVFSRFEVFDNMFKKELAVEEGLKKGLPFIKKKIRFIKDVDYRVACFYAKYFSDVMDMRDDYSFSEIKYLVRSIVNYAKNNGICSDTFKLVFSDSNNVFHINMYGLYTDLELSIKSTEDFIQGIIDLISFLGSTDEHNEADKRWLNRYLHTVYDDISKGIEAKPFIVGKVKAVKNGTNGLGDGKVVYINKNM